MGARLDVLVVGAGPVGLTMAAELVRHGLSCRIIDKAAVPSDKSRALVLWSRSLEMLEDIASVEPFVSAGHPVHSMSLYSGGRRLMHVVFEIDSLYGYALMLPQNDTERLLDQHLRRLGVQVERERELTDVTVDDDGVRTNLRGANGSTESVRSDWLIGCDGAHSTVRHHLGMPFSGDAEPNDWMLADVHLAGPVPVDELTIYFHEAGVLLFFPISGQRYRVFADLGAATSDDHPPDPTLADVQRMLDTRGPGGIVVSNPVWLAGFRIHERKVAAYRHDRVFLAGDAAHIHSPAGGQGMNTGMQDAYNLAWKLGLVQHGHAHASLLESYSLERSAVGEAVLRNAGLLTRVATLRGPLAQHLRNRLYRLLGSLDIVQHRMSNLLSELSINYRRSPISGEHRGLTAHAWLLGSGVASGDRAPDGELIDERTGRPTRLFEVLRGTRHVLLLFTGVAVSSDQLGPLGEVAAVADRYRETITTCFIVPDGMGRPEVANTRVLRDPDATLHRRYAAALPTAYLIRPDNYVGYRSQPADKEHFLAYLSKYLR